MEQIFILVLLLALTGPAMSWDSIEMEVFDVVEEVNENFYELMGITQDAEVSEIKRAYRTLSKQIHPDKSDAPDAEIKFRQLVSVYETLKDPERRKHYNKVLVDGLPDWRSAVYYYRRARKMSMIEIVFILTVVISIAQYLMAWGTYWDHWNTIEFHTRKLKKKKKKVGEAAGPDVVEEYAALLPKPSLWNILPIQLCKGVYRLVRYGPGMVKEWREDTKRREQQKKEEEEREERERLELEREEEERKARKAQNKKRRKVVVPERRDLVKREVIVDEDGCTHTAEDPLEAAAAGLNTGLWSSEEFSELAKLMNKYPGGTIDRWEVIAEHLNRSTYEVTKMAQKVREKLAAGAWLQNQEQNIQAKIKVKTRSTEENSSTSSDAHWSPVQQKALERALKSYPKGTDQRWEKIAKQVPEKTSEDCINRFKFLAEKIRKKKEEEEKAAREAEEEELRRENEENGDNSEDSEQNDNDSGVNDSEDDSGNDTDR